MLTASSHLKTTHQKCIKALLFMNSNALDATLTALKKLIAACTPKLKNILVMTLPRYITIFAAATNSNL